MIDITNNIFARELGSKAYELKDHLGNLRTTFSDIKMPTISQTPPYNRNAPYSVDLLSKSEYYPYGMKINDLSYNATGARYGYNSQEQSTELNLDGNHTTAEFWEYDTRSARRWNLDPVDQISKSNYSTFGNNPIAYNDLNGDRWGVTVLFGEVEAGAGIWFSLDNVKQHGTAYDEIGTTLFTASKFNVFNKDTDIHDSYDWSFGGSASQSVGVTHSWRADLFGDLLESNSISSGLNFDGELGFGGGVGFSMDMFTLQFGYGAGVKVSSINTKIDQSISFTDKEAKLIDDKVGLGLLSSKIKVSEYTKVKVNGELMFKASIVGSKSMKDGKLKKVEIKIPVSCYSYKNEKGETVPNNIWKSDNYRKAEKKLKNK